jgi:hypothetical protein
LTGAGVALTFSPASLSFGRLNVGLTHAPVSLTVTNVGSVTVNFSNIAIGGTNPGDFAIRTNTCGTALGAAANCTIGVTFTPQAAGTRSAALTFTDDAYGSPQVLPLAGSGVNVTRTALSSNNNPSTFGQAVLFTATVSPSSATGTVQFRDGGNLLGTGALSAGTATLTTSSLASGTHSITAAYSGDTNDNSSTSAGLVQTVN